MRNTYIIMLRETCICLLKRKETYIILLNVEKNVCNLLSPLTIQFSLSCL